MFVSLELNSGAACTASVVGGWVGLVGEQSNAVLRGSATLCERCDLAIGAPSRPKRNRNHDTNFASRKFGDEILFCKFL